MGETHRRNVVVVGAGASKEFGLPTGFELLSDIAKLAGLGHDQNGNFRGDGVLASAIQDVAGTNGFDAMRFIKNNVPIAPSIDNFLHTHKDQDEVSIVGKLLISRAILNAERNSSLYYDRTKTDQVNFLRVPREQMQYPKDMQVPAGYSWLGEFFKLLVEERDIHQFIEAIRSVTFISFNYDRCIAQYLLHAAKQYFGLDSQAVLEVDKSLSIIYPYGSLGLLHQGDLRQNSYGEDASSHRLVEIAKGLRTFTEGVSTEGDSNAIHEAFSSCEIVIFVGFGFIPLNLKLLFGDRKYQVQRVLGTSLGLSKETKDLVVGDLVESLLRIEGVPPQLSKDRAILSELTSRELFAFHRGYLRGTYH